MGLRKFFKSTKLSDKSPKKQLSVQATSDSTSTSSLDETNSPTASIPESPTSSNYSNNVLVGETVSDSATTSVSTTASSSKFKSTSKSSSNKNNNPYKSTTEASLNVPKELSPIVTLLNCQSSRLYLQTQINLINLETDAVWVLEGVIRGNQAFFHQPSQQQQIATTATSSFRPLMVDLLSCSFRILPELNAIVLNEKYQVRLIDQNMLKRWIGAIKLSNYEYTRLSEAYTASLLSCKGVELSDLHVVLGGVNNKFAYEEDCSIKFQADSKWIDCRVVVKPRKSKGKAGSIEFYAGSKNGGAKNNKTTKTKKKNLICAVDMLDSAHSIFPHVSMIDSTCMIKLHGDFSIYESIQDETLSPAIIRSRSSSVASSTSITAKSHKRMSSLASVYSTASVASNSSNSTSKSKREPTYKLIASELYILPKPHRAVPSYETMIRLLIPIYDSFHLYGRPTKLKSDKRDSESLLFALPSLPRVKIMDVEEHALQVVEYIWEELCETSEPFKWHRCFNEAVMELIRLDPQYAGFGLLKEELNTPMGFENPLVRFNNDMNSASSSNSNRRSVPDTPKRVISISDLPKNVIIVPPVDRNRSTNSDLDQYQDADSAAAANEEFTDAVQDIKEPGSTQVDKALALGSPLLI